MNEQQLEPAAAWVRESLSQGAAISAQVLLSASLQQGSLRVLAPDHLARSDLRRFREGSPGLQEARAMLPAILDDLARRGARCIVVADDVRRRGDPIVAWPPGPWAYLGDHVVHWQEFSDGGGSAAATAIRRGATGYPTNAFVTRRSAADLHLVSGQDLEGTVPSEIASSLMAIVVSAFDGDSYIVWEPERVFRARQ